MPVAPRTVSTFLVEGFLPTPADGTLRRLVERLEAEAGRAGAAPGIRHVHSSVVPEDEMCLCLIEGPSTEAVRAVAEQAGLQVIRVSEAMHVFGAGRAAGGS